MGLTRRRAAVVVPLVCLALSATGYSAWGASGPAQLFGRPYVSTAVIQDGARHPLFEGTEVRVEFERRDSYDVVRWRADCNIFGARVEVTEEQLVLGRIAGTAIGCEGVRARQDRWTLRFFASDPSWRARQGHTLRLMAGQRTIELRRRSPSG